MGLKVAYVSDEAIEKDAQALLADYARERGTLTCHWFVIQRRLEPQPVLRRVARG
jgi:hypothetical protein